jgi:hypothetical protein
MAIWGRRCRSVGCHEARRNKRGHAGPLIVGIVTGRAGMDHVCRGTQPVLDQERTIRLRRNGRGRQKKYRLVRGAVRGRLQLRAGRGAGLFRAVALEATLNAGPTMEISDDWPEYAVGPKDSLFAIGVASSNFTALEAVMQFIFATVLDLTIENSEMISAKIGAEATVILTRQKLATLKWEDRIEDRVQHFLRGFNICLENRNHLMHSEVSWTATVHPTEKTFLFKRNKKGELHMAGPKLPELRRIADSMMIFTHYGRRLGNWINNHSTDPPTFPEDVFPLPDKPALPHSLEYSPDPQPL